MSITEGGGSNAERQEWLRWLVEDSLVLSTTEKVVLIGNLISLSESGQRQLLEILLDEKRALDRVRRKTFASEDVR